MDLSLSTMGTALACVDVVGCIALMSMCHKCNDISWFTPADPSAGS